MFGKRLALNDEELFGIDRYGIFGKLVAAIGFGQFRRRLRRISVGRIKQPREDAAGALRLAAGFLLFGALRCGSLLLLGALSSCGLLFASTLSRCSLLLLGATCRGSLLLLGALCSCALFGIGVGNLIDELAEARKRALRSLALRFLLRAPRSLG